MVTLLLSTKIEKFIILNLQKRPKLIVWAFFVSGKFTIFSYFRDSVKDIDLTHKNTKASFAIFLVRAVAQSGSALRWG